MRVSVGCHTFRATGITAYLEAGGTLENAEAMAAHESPRTTKLYDRTASLFIWRRGRSDGGCVNGGAYGCALFRTPPGPISPGLGALNR